MTVAIQPVGPFVRVVRDFEGLLHLGGIDTGKIRVLVDGSQWDQLVRMVNSQIMSKPYGLLSTEIEFGGIRFEPSQRPLINAGITAEK